MKKITLIVSILTFMIVNVMAQDVHTWDRYKVTFDSPVVLNEYEAESIDVFGSDNPKYAVDISGFPISTADEWYGTGSIKNIASSVAQAFGFKETGKGGKLPLIKEGYYLVTQDMNDDNTVNATVVLVIAKSYKLGYYIEGTVYCYDQDEKTGIKIAKTFKFLE